MSARVSLREGNVSFTKNGEEQEKTVSAYLDSIQQSLNIALAVSNTNTAGTVVPKTTSDSGRMTREATSTGKAVRIKRQQDLKRQLERTNQWVPLVREQEHLEGGPDKQRLSSRSGANESVRRRRQEVRREGGRGAQGGGSRSKGVGLSQEGLSGSETVEGGENAPGERVPSRTNSTLDTTQVPALHLAALHRPQNRRAPTQPVRKVVAMKSAAEEGRRGTMAQDRMRVLTTP